MNAKTERRVVRWVHLVLSVPILGFIYGPVAEIPRAAFATRYVFVPAVIVSGLWLWKGHAVRRRVTRPGVSLPKSRFPGH
ncbi:MAG: hypothetical protein JWN86_226 [Planctomycetota bacterium]|nr:hypothetical protein [Planctomycetota bacterium]